MNKFEYKNLTPFKWFVLENFPFIEADFDALTEWQLFCKLGKEINKIIDSQNIVGEQAENLTNAFNNLKKYVDNYFDNLDVQDEINNKLNEMTEDGSLTNLIKAYVNPYINAQNQAIEGIHNEVISLASGSPKGVYSSVSALESANPDTGVYIVSADGHIYSWTKDGTNAVDLGVYQATIIGDNEIKFNNLDTLIQNSFNDNAYNESPSLTYEDGFYDNSTIGSTITKATLGTIECSVINVQPGEIYYIYGYSQDSARSWAIGDVDNKNILRETTSYQYHLAKVIIPYNGRKLFINHWKNRNATIVTKTTQLGLNQNNMIKLQNNFLKMCSKSRCITLKGLITGIAGRSFGRWIKVDIPNSDDLISANDKLKISFDVYAEDISKITYCDVWLQQNRQPGDTIFQINEFSLTSTNNENKPAITKLNDKMIHFECEVAYPIFEDTYKEILFTPSIASSDANYVCKVVNINFYNVTKDTPISIYNYVANYSANIIDEYFNFVLDEGNIISYFPSIGFSKWYAIGDSITEKNFRAKKNYVDYCTEELKYISSINLGAGGTGYVAYQGNTFIDRINGITNYNIETDIVTVMGSVNDMFFVKNKLGQLGDTTTDTLYGSMYQFFNTLFTKFNGVRVGCISPINWRYSDNEKQLLTLYIKALKETCELFNVPFLDIHDKTNLRPENDTFRNTYYLADGTDNEGQIDSYGVHPNSEGHKLMYGRIKDFISKL